MVACFVGEHKKKMHALTGLGILKTWDAKYADWDYDTFMAAYKAHDPEVVKAYTIGKKVNFTTEYGAQAPKLAETLIIPEDEAQLFIDAKEEAFPVAREWKNSVEDEVRATGQVRTMCGAVRHLADALMSEDRYEASKALRQGVNTEVQSSSAEMIKRASGAMWRAGLRFKYDCRFMFPVHDEIVWSVRSDHLLAFLKEAHACMVQPFANMQIPIVSSIAFGKSFGPADQCEIGTEVSEEAVAAGLKAWQQSLEVAH
jgi:DNA polymerase I-like protein with 3'-5' exonuclease and polymerase domains